MVGINSQIYSRTGELQGLSFAIPIDLALKIQRQIVATGHASRPARRLRPGGESGAGGSLPAPHAHRCDPARRAAGRPGAKAGLLPGDVIVGVDGKPIASAGDVQTLVTMAQPGQRLLFDVWRDGQAGHLTVTLGEASRRRARNPPPARRPTPCAQFGLQLRPLQPVERLAIGSAVGLLVESTSGPSQAAGMQTGDVVAVDQRQTGGHRRSGPRGGQNAGNTVALLVQRGGEQLFVPLSQKAPPR